MCQDIGNCISKCEKCEMNRRSLQKETLLSDFSNIIVDSFSNWLEVEQTKTKTADDVIRFCNSKCQQFGVPDKLFADNVPYNCKKIQDFAKVWNFEIGFRGPHDHQSNSLAEKYRNRNS